MEESASHHMRMKRFKDTPEDIFRNIVRQHKEIRDFGLDRRSQSMVFYVFREFIIV